MTFPDELRVLCAEFAEKYGYQVNALDRGFEAFAVHLSAADGDFLRDTPDGSNPLRADLRDNILRNHDRGVDATLRMRATKSSS